MTFYKLRHSVDAAEIGVYPQARIDHSSYPGFVNIEVPLEGKIEGELSPPTLRLEKQAKMTDLLSITPLSYEYLALSPRAFDLIRRFETDEFQACSAHITNGKANFQYHLVHFPSTRNRDYVDWGKSVFGHTTYMQRELITEMKFQGYEEFIDFKRSLYKKEEDIILRKLALNDGSEMKDIFRLLFISGGVYVSDNLKNALQAEGITGCSFAPTSELCERTTKENYPHMFEAKA